MKGYKIATILGIDLEVHFSFFIIIALFVLTSNTIYEGLNTLFFILSAFSIVILHEYGHALVAKHYNIRTRSIVIMALGGIAQLDYMPKEPRKEFLIAIAGPLVNFILAIILFIIGAFWRPDFLLTIMVINIIILIFNLLPAYPMDGGRLLRASLAKFISYKKASIITTYVAQGLALVMFVFGLRYNIIISFIGVMIWINAGSERRTEYQS